MITKDIKYIIIDECGKYVVGYVFDGGNISYISYGNQDSFSIKIIKNYAKVVEDIRGKLIVNSRVGRLQKIIRNGIPTVYPI